MPATRTEWAEGRKLAAELIKRHPEALKDVPPLTDILFVLDTEGTPKSKGRIKGACVSKIAGKVADFIDQGDKIWMLEWFEANVAYMTLNQRQVLMFHELQHFELDGDMQPRLRGHDVEEFYIVADHPKIGLHWGSETRGDVPDIMAPDFTWGKQGQAVLNMTVEDALEHQRNKVGKAITELEKAAAPVDDTPPTDPDPWEPAEPLASNVVQFPAAQAAGGGDD